MIQYDVTNFIHSLLTEAAAEQLGKESLKVSRDTELKISCLNDEGQRYIILFKVEIERGKPPTMPVCSTYPFREVRVNVSWDHGPSQLQ